MREPDPCAASGAPCEALLGTLSDMCHELRTPLNAILGLATLALSEPDNPPQTAEALLHIRAAGQQLLTLLNGALEKADGCTARAETPVGEVDGNLLRGCKVLLAEDNPINAEITRRLLEKAGMCVVCVENGQAEVEAFAASRPYEYAALLTDIRMPVLDGLEAIRAIRRLNRPDSLTVPAIALTANDFAEDRQRSELAGLNAHLAKPISPQALYGALCALLRPPGSAPHP